ncbi:PGF-CTERM sorting domain-containing protein [Halapricum sp. CBA1109]|uniref:DUF7490 domain-containing protein n=1 Tax=Halapricum sp. CBA1109 TaxID=2668068 RepID=UPI0012FC4CB6|nr:PGF-CTERM sorting domain-containing protein [Halapricum sp. CBA1109]MUV90299.1 PGF-CTERM sorting domain-containing protein [Halapricum sp. CBA1109]
MRREYVMGFTAAAVVAVAILGVVAVPGTTAEASLTQSDGQLTLRETPITPGAVSGDTATLTVTNWLEHTGGPVENVTILVRAVDQETGLIDTRTRASVGTVDSPGDHPVETTLTVNRSGDYRIETLVFENGTRVASGRSHVSGLDGLTPDYAESGLRFHQFGGSLPTIAYSVESVDDRTVRVNATAFLTNAGDDPAGDLQLLVRARQTHSNIVADRATIPVEDVRPGRTANPRVTLRMPDNYTYRLDAVLTRDDVIVDTESAVADLNPTREVSEDTDTESVDVDADAFANDSAADPSADDETVEETADGAGPGFGVVAAILAVLGAALAVARRTDD